MFVTVNVFVTFTVAVPSLVLMGRTNTVPFLSRTILPLSLLTSQVKRTKIKGKGTQEKNGQSAN